VLPNGAHGNIVRHRSIMVESGAYSVFGRPSPGGGGIPLDLDDMHNSTLLEAQEISGVPQGGQIQAVSRRAAQCSPYEELT